jgi:hypothetical protein
MIVNCPWCLDLILIEELNCGIFRHGYDYRFTQLSPHATQKECEKLTVYGCGRPFQIINGKPFKCDYI